MLIRELEKAVLQFMLAGDERILKLARIQLEAASIYRRKRASNQYRTYFKVPESVQRIQTLSEFAIADVMADVPGGDFSLDFHLFIKNGVLRHMDSYAYADSWIKNLPQVRLSYLSERPAGSGLLYKSESRDKEYFYRRLTLGSA